MRGRFLITPVDGLDYETLTTCGRTDENGCFECVAGETITFSVGGLILGSAIAAERMTPADLSIEVAGNIRWIANRNVTNITRFLMSLNCMEDAENKITITDKIRDLCRKYRKRIYFNQPETMFTEDETVKAFFAELGTTLVSGAYARNYLRRGMNGIVKMKDVKIPLRDGGYVTADIFRPEKEGKYPVIISFGGYGKAFWVGKETTPEEIEQRAVLEDRYFSGALDETDYLSFHIASLPAGDPLPQIPGLPQSGSVMNPMMTHISECFERANVMDWVPEGYIVIHADSRGLGISPGSYYQFGRQEADDYYDAIEWAGVQEWSNGNVGTYGASFYAMNAFNVASLNPPHLKAFIPLCGDMDPYRDYFRFGGLLNKFGFTPKISKWEFSGIDLGEYAAQYEFDDPEVFNEHSIVAMRNTPDKIKIPFYTAVSLEQAFIHTRGTSMIYEGASTPHDQKYLDVMSEDGVHYWMYGKDFMDRYKKFFAHWLKGEEITLDAAPVHMMIRTGYGSYFWQDAQSWPVPKTEYRKLYLYAVNEDKDQMHTLMTEPAGNGSISYPADQEIKISFETEAFEEDTVIAGHIMAKLFVSSTSKDMTVFTYLNVVDEDDDIVPIVLDLNPAIPVSKGALKVSHRKLDTEKSTEYRPFHTHLKEDVQLLAPDEIVEADVEFVPATVRIRKGWKLRLDIMPKNEASELFDDHDDYSSGAINTIYSGELYPSYLQIPIVG